jgi:hypothetical protein
MSSSNEFTTPNCQQRRLTHHPNNIILHRTFHNLKGILESGVMLDWLATSLDSLVRTVELEAEYRHDDNDESLGQEAGQDSWTIIGRVLGAEDTGANDTSDCTTTNEGSGCECSFPLTTNIVGLVSKEGRAVGIRSNGGQENAEVANSVILGVT